jgi:hypothetical protein
MDTILNFLLHEQTYISSNGYHDIETPFDLKPTDFLSFAENDLSASYDHNFINALSNAKRALDCQIDTLLIGFGFFEIAKKKYWSFPTKIDKIKELGILAPRVLNKINKKRNLMEHEFVKPNRETVEDFVDITALFLASTDKYIYSFKTECQIENDSISEYWIDTRDKYKSSELFFEIVYKDKMKKIKKLLSLLPTPIIF